MPRTAERLTGRARINIVALDPIENGRRTHRVRPARRKIEQHRIGQKQRISHVPAQRTTGNASKLGIDIAQNLIRILGRECRRRPRTIGRRGGCRRRRSIDEAG